MPNSTINKSFINRIPNIQNVIRPSVYELPIKPIQVSPGSIDAVQDRMVQHKAVLESFGITSLSSLGKLTINGTVVTQAGLTKPDSNQISGRTTFQSAFRILGGAVPTPQVIAGAASLLKSTPFSANFFVSPASTPAAPTAANIMVNTAYWAATEIHLADNTTVILKHPHQYLVIMAEKLTVGNNVTFTWERPQRSIPAKQPAQAPRPAAPMSTHLGGDPGAEGIAGGKGGRGYDGVNAPELEMWLLELEGRPAFDMRGHDGTQGGEGQNGGSGGAGSKGKTAQLDWAGFCKAGSGAGGNGGRGGAAGSGGDGGNGGRGGKFSLFAPQAILSKYLEGFYVSVDGGKGGPGGAPGVPGSGGQGGKVGDSLKASFGTVCGSNGRTSGMAGAQGAPGVQGRPGVDGDRQSEPIRMKAIDSDEFRRKMLEPIIYTVNPPFAGAGDTVTIEGKRFTQTDKIVVDGEEVKTLVYSDTALQFTVPQTYGGTRTVQLKQTDGTLSNKASIYILPKISYAQQNNVTTQRLLPGNKVVLVGSGFSDRAIVQVNGQDMPDVRLLSTTLLEFTLVRPSQVEVNPNGERVKAKVLQGDGTSSNEIDLVLETFHLLVLGDSVTWGQGLVPHEKMHALVGAVIQARQGNIGFYPQLRAHSGAIIGKTNDSTDYKKVDGEVPSSYPTIFQQFEQLFEGDPAQVDLIIMDGGINDVDVRTIMNPHHGDDLGQLLHTYFYQNMKKLLETAAAKFKNAKIIVTGYYPPVSEHSDLGAIEAMVTALGIAIGGAGGGAGAAVLSKGELKKIFERNMMLMNDSKKYIQQAISEVNATPTGNSRMFFADPGIGPEHSALTADPYVYGINIDLSPQDLLAVERHASCTAAGCTGMDLELCKRASMGHPNSRGAQAYANAIMPLL